MVPDVLLLVPRYVVTSQLHLLGNYLGLIIPYVSFGSIFAIFVLRTFFASVPGELIEAARMDGASHWTIFWRIMLPLSRPILATLAIIQLIRVWNDFIWPFVVISKKSQYTLALILKTFSGDFGTQWGLIMACYVMASLPLLLVFALASKQFIKGLTVRRDQVLGKERRSRAMSNEQSSNERWSPRSLDAVASNSDDYRTPTGRLPWATIEPRIISPGAR